MSEEPASAKDLVVLVDDDALFLRMLQDAIGDRYRIAIAQDGAAGLELIGREPPAAILADHTMPVITGIELLKRARQVAPFAARILLTASDRLDDAIEAINNARVTRFVVKPFRPVELLSILDGAIHEAKLQEENARLVAELHQKNQMLNRALSEVQTQERKLAQALAELKAQKQPEPSAPPPQAPPAAGSEVIELEVEAQDGLAPPRQPREPLTGLYSRLHFDEVLTAEVARAARHGRNITLLRANVDHFKTYNELLGKPAGDTLLSQLGQLLDVRVDTASPLQGRLEDMSFCFGGGDFALLLPEANKAGGKVRADRLRAQIAEYAFNGRERLPGGRLTMSIGVATFPGDGLSARELLDSAEQALRVAKKAGRNRIIATGDEYVLLGAP